MKKRGAAVVDIVSGEMLVDAPDVEIYTCIDVTPDVRIREMPQNWCIDHRQTIKKGSNAGEDHWRVVGYYGSPGAAAEALSTRHVGLVLPYPEAITTLEQLRVGIRFAADVIAAAIGKPPR